MYAKVFASLWEGTLYGKTDAQLVFIFLLARCGSDGFVRCVPEAIAAPTGLALDRVCAAIEILESPDPDSNSKEMDGIRLERIGPIGSWNIVNYLKYRNLQDMDTVRAQTAERVRRHREAKRPVTVGNGEKRSVTVGNGKKRQAEAEAEALEPTPTSPASPDDDPLSFFLDTFWPQYPRKRGVSKAKAVAEFHKIVKGWPGDLDDLATAIMAGLRRHKDLWEGTDHQFIPHPVTWLSQRRWEDES